jgi:hypothetical protein
MARKGWRIVRVGGVDAMTLSAALGCVCKTVQARLGDSGGKDCVVSTRNVTGPGFEDSAASEIYPRATRQRCPLSRAIRLNHGKERD